MTESDTSALGEDEPEIVHWYPPRHQGGPHLPQAMGARSVGAASAGAVAMGVLAFGAMAIGALAIGRLAVGRAHFKDLEIDRLTVRSLKILEP
jgi:hypothetical protein